MSKDGPLEKDTKTQPKKVMNMKFLRITEQKTRMDKIINKIFREKLEFKNLLIQV
jgi:hypothetical protein